MWLRPATGFYMWCMHFPLPVNQGEVYAIRSARADGTEQVDFVRFRSPRRDDGYLLADGFEP